MSFYNYQLQILQLSHDESKKDVPPAEDPESKLRAALRDNIDKLGGIEDTVGVMHQSLQDFEVQNTVSRQYKGFMRLNPSVVEVRNKVGHY